MTEEELKNIDAPEKDAPVSKNRKNVNTIIFTIISGIFNLAITIGLCFGLIFLVVYICNRHFFQVGDANIKFILWPCVIAGIALGYFINFMLCRLVIKLFKMEDKLDRDFALKYLGKEK
ncbi:MAG: hypothetical protein MJ169_08550 [Treponema sp.]|nr:hypothetical protein [Treponema sp.]